MRDAATEARERDAALYLLEVWRAALVARAREVARDIAARAGRVTSVEVLAALREGGWSEAMEGYDARWMGCVFRAGTGWRRVGYEPTGSHRRPVAVWARR